MSGKKKEIGIRNKIKKQKSVKRNEKIKMRKWNKIIEEKVTGR